MLRRSLHMAAAIGILSACQGAPSQPAAADAGAEPAPAALASPAPAPAATPTAPAATPSPLSTSAPTQAAAPASAPTEPAAPQPLPVQAYAVDGATELPLDLAGEPTAVEPRSAFRLAAGVALVDAHAVLLDEKGDMVPSKGTSELGQAASFHLAPREPLRPGSRYTLKVEAAGGKELRDAQGHVYAPAVVALRTTGARPAGPAPAKKAKKTHRRR